MPEEGISKLAHEDILTEEEMVTAVRACAQLGIDKVRITGGEPLLKRNIISICNRISEISEIKTLVMTTNGILLTEYVKELKKAGVQRLNISLDTLDSEKFGRITRIGSLDKVWRGLMCAINEGFEKIKINCVLINGFNDDEIPALVSLTQKYPLDVRFIELMGMNEDGFFNENSFLPSSAVLEQLPELQRVGDNGVCTLYSLPGSKGSVGLISPLTAKFCSSCNRIRITADGKVKPCLHSNQEISIKGLELEGMKYAIERAILEKPASHGLTLEKLSQSGRSMNRIGG